MYTKKSERELIVIRYYTQLAKYVHLTLTLTRARTHKHTRTYTHTHSHRNPPQEHSTVSLSAAEEHLDRP